MFYTLGSVWCLVMVILHCQMGNSGSVPLWSLLGRIMCGWEDSRYDPMSKKEVVFYYDSEWPSYSLDFGKTWCRKNS